MVIFDIACFRILSEVIALKNSWAYVCDDARNYMYIQGIIADILFAWRLCTWQMKYSDQPVLSGLVGLLNLNISQGVTAFNSLAITPIDLRIVKRRNRSFPIGIQKIDPPLQHQLTLIRSSRYSALWIIRGLRWVTSMWLIWRSAALSRAVLVSILPCRCNYLLNHSLPFSCLR